jgi:2-C-methyl-D-erythritol 4-phosphate cytidylyltransferase/2-C-methyl-D-erythritol 2,4-cyclodiphosphate synthase
VIDPAHHAEYEEAVAGLSLLPPVEGGAERADSVRIGLASLEHKEPAYVLVHDAARPFISSQLITRLIAQLTPTTGAVPALPVADTVRRYMPPYASPSCELGNNAGQWQDVSRDGLMRIQTPQAFPYGKLVTAMAAVTHPTDEAAAWLEANGELAYVEGEVRANKITTPTDLEEAMASTATRTAVGMGFDVHQLMPAGQKHVIRLGGIDIAHDHKLHGHSDADVVLHAIVDALLGALAAGDIGSHFPPSDPQWKGADSALFVKEALRLVNERQGRIAHLDVTVICEHPKIGPHRDAMRQSIAALLELPLERVSLKATTTEKLGFTGREEGIAAQAVATVMLPESL